MYFWPFSGSVLKSEKLGKNQVLFGCVFTTSAIASSQTDDLMSSIGLMSKLLRQWLYIKMTIAAARTQYGLSVTLNASFSSSPSEEKRCCWDTQKVTP